MSAVIRIVALTLIALTCASSGRAETLNAKVTAVSGDVATLTVEGNRLPNPGDGVSIFGQIPGLDGDVLIGRGKVTEVRDAVVLAKIDARGTLKQGLTAQIVSDQPRAATAAKGGAGPADGFGKLFNGQDLSGWKLQSGQIGSWRAEGGSLITSGDPKGWLFTEKEYSDFELRLEYKVSANANSGVCVRSPGPDAAQGDQDPSFKGLEIQIVDDDSGEASAGGYPTGSVWGIAAPSQRVTRPVGEWNAMDIVVRGRQVTVSINGTRVVDTNLDDHAAKVERFPGLQRTSGFVGLQSYQNQLEFRNIAIKSLSSAGADESAAQPVVPPAGPAPSATSPRVDRIEIIEKGIYQATGGKWVEDPSVASGKRLVGTTTVTFTDHTTTIPARKVSFGFRYRILGEPNDAPVTLKRVIIYPKGGLRNPKTGKTWFQDTVEIRGKKIGEPGYIGYNFGDAGHPTGTWTLQLWYQDRKLAEQAFNVVNP